MNPRRAGAMAAAGLIVCLAVGGCVPGVEVRRDGLLSEDRMNNVAVLLFDNDVPDSPPHVAEMTTDAFSLELNKYFPALVDRYSVRDFLRTRGIDPHRALTPENLRALGEALEVDGIFVGAITGYGEKRTFFGWNGKPHFYFGCRLISTSTGRILVAAQAEVSESHLLPLENPRDYASYGARMMTRLMRLDERFGPPMLTREMADWKRAMEAYERRRFWDAAEEFGAIVRSYRAGDLRDEALLYLGRSLEELGLHDGAEEVYRGVRTTSFAPQAMVRLAEVRFDRGDGDEVLRLRDSLWERFPDREEPVAGSYLAGLVHWQRGETARAIEELERVSPGSPWHRFACYALAAPYQEAGDEDAARLALESAAAPGAVTEAERRLQERAMITLGDWHYARGERQKAAEWYGAVRGEFEPEAVVALASLAAEEGRYEDALAYIAPAEAAGDLRWSGEALLLAGACHARLGLWTEAAETFAHAIDRCADWEESGKKEARLLAEREEVRTELAAEITPREGDVVHLLLYGTDGHQLRDIRDRHRSLALRLERIEGNLEGDPDPEGEAVLRREIQERAEFSLAQVAFEQGREELGRESVFLGTKSGEGVR